MKVAMVSEHASPLAVLGGTDAGGQNVHVAALATHLGAREDVEEVVVFTRRDAASPPDAVPFAPGVTVRHVEAGPRRVVPKDELLPHMGAFATELGASWESDPPDVVHAHFWMSGIAALEAARELGIPVVVTFHALGVEKRRHQGRDDTSPAVRVVNEARLAEEADVVIATSRAEVVELTAMGASPRRVEVVPCGVDLSVFSDAGRSTKGTTGSPRVLVVGRLVPRKGTEDVISAVRDLPRAELLIAGGPDRRCLGTDPDARRLAAWARREGVAGRTELLGRVPHESLPDLYRSADVVVCAPWYEPFGIVPLEAMACGVPVVATAVGGLLDTVVDGTTGIHVPPRCPTAIAEAVGSVLEDRPLAARLGAAGARRAHSYAWSGIAASSVATYRDLVNSTVGSRSGR